MSAGNGDRESGPERELRLRLEEVESQRREFETRLRMLEQAVETMSTGVTISDMEGKIIYVNPADARMHGYAVDELVGRQARGYAATGSPVPSGYEPPGAMDPGAHRCLRRRSAFPGSSDLGPVVRFRGAAPGDGDGV